MKGNITIKFNQATMIEAVQLYVDAQLTGKHVVKNVKASGDGTSYFGAIFDIELEEPQQEALEQ